MLGTLSIDADALMMWLKTVVFFLRAGANRGYVGITRLGPCQLEACQVPRPSRELSIIFPDGTLHDGRPPLLLVMRNFHGTICNFFQEMWR